MIQSLSQNRRFKIKTILLGSIITITFTGCADKINSFVDSATSPIEQKYVEPEIYVSDEERTSKLLLEVYLSTDNLNTKETATRDISTGITTALSTFDLGLSASINAIANYNSGDSFPVVTCLAPTKVKTVRKKEAVTGREYTVEESDTPEIRISLDTVKLTNGQTELGIWRYDGSDVMARVAGTQVNNKVAYIYGRDIVILDGNKNTVIDNGLVYECKEDISHITSVAGMRYDTNKGNI